MKTNWPAFGFGCLLLAGAAVAVLPASAQVAQQPSTRVPAPLASISAVEVAQPGQQTTVRISGTGELHYRASRLDSPPRLVLDFSETRMNVQNNKVPSDFAPVLDVRMGQPNPGQSRMVIDLAKQVPFSTQADGSNVTIFFKSPVSLATPAALHPSRKPAPRGLVAVNVPNMPLPAWLTGKDMGFARPASEPVAPAPQNPSEASSQDTTPAPEKKYTGDPISVNLKDVDLKDFFRLIHEISGLNVVLDPSVRGTVTLVLDEVPWDQALDIVFRNNGLTKEIDGNVLRIATQDTLARSGPAPGTPEGAVGRHRNGDRHARAELCPGGHDGHYAEKVSDSARRRFRRHSFQHLDHPGYSLFDPQDRQLVAADRPEIAAGGN